LVIFEYAWRSIENHPWLGVGTGDWARPAWMHSSIDNFYLVTAVRHGLPASAFLLLTVFSLVFMLAKKKGLDGRLDACRTGFIICIVSIIIVAWSVALWDSAFVLFLFWLGGGVWMLDARGIVNRPRVRTRPLRG
jgi:O-antigen ligase